MLMKKNNVTASRTSHPKPPTDLAMVRGEGPRVIKIPLVAGRADLACYGSWSSSHLTRQVASGRAAGNSPPIIPLTFSSINTPKHWYQDMPFLNRTARAIGQPFPLCICMSGIDISFSKHS